MWRPVTGGAAADLQRCGIEERGCRRIEVKGGASTPTRFLEPCAQLRAIVERRIEVAADVGPDRRGEAQGLRDVEGLDSCLPAIEERRWTFAGLVEVGPV